MYRYIIEKKMKVENRSEELFLSRFAEISLKKKKKNTK